MSAAAVNEDSDPRRPASGLTSSSVTCLGLSDGMTDGLNLGPVSLHESAS